MNDLSDRLSYTNLLDFYLKNQFQNLEDKIMAKVKDEIAQVNASMEAMEARVTGLIDGLKAEIAEAKANAPDDADFTALDAIEARLDAFNAAPAVLPDEPPAEGEAPPAPAV